MLNITDNAKQQLLLAIQSEEQGAASRVRVSVKGGGCFGFQHELNLDTESDDEDEILTLEHNGTQFQLVIDVFSKMYLEGTELGYVTGDMGEGFKFSGGAAVKKTCACGSSFSG